MSKKILLADDSITIQKVISITFSSPEYEITIVDNGNDAIKKAFEVKPDIILTDIVMPGKNGYEVCDAIKSDPSLQSIPVLLLTGAFEAFDEQRARQVGADAWLSKPFETQALIDKVNGLLSKPAVKKPVEAKPAQPKAAPKPPPPPPSARPSAPTPPPSSKPGVPPPPPPRKPSPPPSSPKVEEAKASEKRIAPEKHEEEVMELTEAESFELTGDTVGDESGWEAVPLNEEPKETPITESFNEPIKEELPEEKEISFTEETKPSESIEETEGTGEPEVGFEDLEAALEETEKPLSKEPVSEQVEYEKTYEEQELVKPLEQEATPQSEATPQVSLSKEELLEQASIKIEALLKDILPDAVKQAVESRVDAVLKEVAEKIIWEVVPALTETMIKEEIQRLKTAKKKT
ncbi:MAG: response regulator [bacterium]